MNNNFDDKYSELITNDFKGQRHFIAKLEFDYIGFIEKWTHEYEEYYKLFKNNVKDRPNIIRLRKSILNIEKICKFNSKNNKNSNLIDVNIIPEKVSTKSPLTILNGEWGSGKTHFLNDLLASIKTEKIKPNIIKKFIYIDSWKYLSSNNLINDFIVELGKNLSSNVGIKQFNTRRMIKNIFNYAVIPNINKRLGLAIPEFKDNNLISTINRDITSPTLVIIDNIERLGPIAWEVIRVTQKLSISTNFIFLLSINKDKFNELCGFIKDNYEWNLQKYISIPFYNLKPNYIDLIYSYNIPKKYIKDINLILTTSISNKFLSIRESEKILQLCGFNKKEIINIPNKYYLLSKFKNVWNPWINEGANMNNTFENVIAKIILKDIENFHKNYIIKLLEINNKYIFRIFKIFIKNGTYHNEFHYNNIINIKFHNIKDIEPEYRFISIEFKKYINKLIYNLDILKKYENDHGEISKDILKIKKIILDIKNNLDLQKINKASYIVYKKYFSNNLTYEKKLTYDEFYKKNIIELLLSENENLIE